MPIHIQDVYARDKVFHIGDNKHPETVQEPQVLTADGDELEAIRRQFTGIPMTAGSVVTWSGEVARFIADNVDLTR